MFGFYNSLLTVDTTGKSFQIEKIPDDLLAGSVRVPVGGIQEVAAALAVGIEDVATHAFRRAPSPLLSERHGSQTQLRYTKATAAQKLVSHGDLPASKATTSGSASCPSTARTSRFA